MLVSFNQVIPNINTRKQSTSFKSLQNGIIEASKAADYATAEKLSNFIYAGGYKLTAENLRAIQEAKKIAAKSENFRPSIIDHLDDAIDVLKQKAREKGINL